MWLSEFIIVLWNCFQFLNNPYLYFHSQTETSVNLGKLPSRHSQQNIPARIPVYTLSSWSKLSLPITCKTRKMLSPSLENSPPTNAALNIMTKLRNLALIKKVFASIFTGISLWQTDIAPLLLGRRRKMATQRTSTTKFKRILRSSRFWRVGWLLPNFMLLWCSSKALCCVKDVCSKQMIILTPCYFSVSFLLHTEQITQSKTNLSASS